MKNVSLVCTIIVLVSVCLPNVYGQGGHPVVVKRQATILDFVNAIVDAQRANERPLRQREHIVPTSVMLHSIADGIAGLEEAFTAKWRTPPVVYDAKRAGARRVVRVDNYAELIQVIEDHANSAQDNPALIPTITLAYEAKPAPPILAPPPRQGVISPIVITPPAPQRRP